MKIVGPAVGDRERLTRPHPHRGALDSSLRLWMLAGGWTVPHTSALVGNNKLGVGFGEASRRGIEAGCDQNALYTI